PEEEETLARYQPWGPFKCGMQSSESGIPIGANRKPNHPASAGKKGNMNTLNEAQVRLFASPNTWMSDEALRQLYAAAKLEGVRLAVGFPDLHSTKAGL